VHLQTEEEVNFKEIFAGQDCRVGVGVVNLSLSACVLKSTTTKKVINFLGNVCTPRENPGYAYALYVIYLSTPISRDAISPYLVEGF